MKINIDEAMHFATEEKYTALAAEAGDALGKVNDGTGAGNDFLGWVTLPEETLRHGTDDIKAVAEELRRDNDYVVCVGIGGSYLGARAVIEALSDNFAAYKHSDSPKIIYAGQNIGEEYLHDLLQLLRDKKYGIIVISKSGTTTEPAIAFRLLHAQLEQQVGKQAAADRIIAITDAARGALHTMARNEGYRTFVIPDNVGGRYSVLTPVGLLPIAVAGYDIDALLRGAADMQRATLHDSDENPAEIYARMRQALYRGGRNIEIMCNYTPALHYMGEWWKQLYGESEGKDGKGIFPAAVDLTTDLHSMGQLIQDGERNLFETVICVDTPRAVVHIPADKENLDGLNYLADKRVDEVNKKAALGTQMAHKDGGVPVMTISIDRLDEYNLGQLIYFFEKACGISGYMQGVNPFNQPGVEAYKKNMFQLLGKPGY